MIRWKLRYVVFELEMELDVNSSSDRARPIITAPDPILKTKLAGKLSEATGAYGHLLPEQPTGFELSVALAGPDFAEYSIELLEGEQLIQPPPPVPEGAVS